MKALVNTGVETLTYMEQADPIAKAGEELVRIQYSGICGSDMHAFLGHDARRPTIVPEASCPKIIGVGLRASWPRNACISDPQMPEYWMRTSSSPALAIGSA